jgi:hypothetical protein
VDRRDIHPHVDSGDRLRTGRALIATRAVISGSLAFTQHTF